MTGDASAARGASRARRASSKWCADRVWRRGDSA
jgi:hypothetical protein